MLYGVKDIVIKHYEYWIYIGVKWYDILMFAGFLRPKLTICTGVNGKIWTSLLIWSGKNEINQKLLPYYLTVITDLLLLYISYWLCCIIWFILYVHGCPIIFNQSLPVEGVVGLQQLFSINLSISSSVNLLVLWSIKCYKMVKNVSQCFP